jgi:hypothetical protein
VAPRQVQHSEAAVEQHLARRSCRGPRGKPGAARRRCGGGTTRRQGARL